MDRQPSPKIKIKESKSPKGKLRQDKKTKKIMKTWEKKRSPHP